MKMDFLTDFSDLSRSDFIGGIDNEALDFGQLEQFMQVAASVGGQLDNTNSNDNAALLCDPKTEAPNTPPTIIGDNNGVGNLPIATISARVVSLAGNTMGHGHGQANNNQHVSSQLPESPPDSGSEPPYSPLQDVHGGLSITSRDLLYTGLTGIHHTPQSQHQELHTTQYITSTATAAQQQQQQHNNHLNGLHQTHLNSHGIRVKPEAGLLMNPSALPQQLSHQYAAANETHIDMSAHNLMYTTGSNNETMLHYEGVGDNLNYSASNHFGTHLTNLDLSDQSTGCVIGTLAGDLPRSVQVVGIRTSAPSTPVHMSSTRKRKMSTQLDSNDVGSQPIKIDPGLTMSPIATSPASLNMPSSSATTTATHNASAADTPAHSTASLSPAPSTVNSHAENSMDGNARDASNGDNADSNSLTPCIRFSPFQPQNWHKLCDQNLQDLAVVYYRVDADKGFNFSVSDDAFVCQKKNHFQITCHARLQGDAKFVKTPSGLEKIKSFQLHFYGVKLEAPNQTIRIEQSQSDRSKKPFFPVPIDLQSHIVSKITVGRLHFSETTNNNMRKKGRPNPEQRYFQLVVGLHVHTASGHFPVVSQGSERIIVRASNPGQFESDVDLCWQRGLTQDSVFHAGRVGINTDRPDESLVVHGNLKVSGHIVQPSDSRAKQEIGELDTSVQLRNLQKIRIVRYRYEPQFAVHSGLRRASDTDAEEIVDTGVIAQEVREVIPDAVQEAGSIVLPNGSVIENFLLVNKDRILMENIGAVKELCNITGSLENRIEHLEKVNNRLVKDKNHSKQKNLEAGRTEPSEGLEMCSNRSLQIIIFLLVIVMAACLAAVSTLYFVEHSKQRHNYKQLELYGSVSNFTSEHEKHWLQQLHRHMMNKSNEHWSNYPMLLFSTTRPTSSRRNNTKSGQELSYNESGEMYSPPGGGGDELLAVMEKPIVSLQPLPSPKVTHPITTSSPLIRSNKTVNSKNKSKWPAPQELQRIASGSRSHASHGSHALQQHSPATPILTAEAETQQNNSESSSEKVAESIPHDFESNSIDIDSQQLNSKKNSKIPSSPLGRLGSSIVKEVGNVAQPQNRDADITLKLNEQLLELGASISTTSSNSLNLPVTVANSHIYKALAPATTGISGLAQHSTNYSIEPPPTSNKSLDNVDGLDLQILSPSNDSVDNPISALYGFSTSRESLLGRRSASPRSVEWAIRRTIRMEIFGTPKHCSENHHDVSNCQSVCFEDSNQLPILSSDSLIPEQSETIQKHARNQNNRKIVDLEEKGNEAGSSEMEINDNEHINLQLPSDKDSKSNSSINKLPSGKSSHATQAISKQFSNEQQSAEAEEILVGIIDPLIDEAVVVVVDETVPILPLLETSQRPPLSDCWEISSCILGGSLNTTMGMEDFCPNKGKSLNLTFSIPLSKYFKEPTLEFHISSSTPLLWTICNNYEHIKHNDKHLINTPLNHQQHPINILPRRQHNTSSVLVLNIPIKGYFVRDVSLRASNDLTKRNICQDKAQEYNTILQYNFRIIRDCD